MLKLISEQEKIFEKSFEFFYNYIGSTVFSVN